MPDYAAAPYQVGAQAPLFPFATTFSTSTFVPQISASASALSSNRLLRDAEPILASFTSPHDFSSQSPSNQSTYLAVSGWLSRFAYSISRVFSPDIEESTPFDSARGGEHAPVVSEPRHDQDNDYYDNPVADAMRLADYWSSGNSRPQQWSEDELRLREIPQYVLHHAPYVHLFSGEDFWPCDIAEHLIHTSPRLNYTKIEGMENNRNLTNLDELNRYGWSAYLTSDDDVEERPDWLGGSRNIPESLPAPSTQDRPHPGGRSSAPAVLITVPKPGGVLDAFWFYFYSYNLGNKVLNVRFGNHVGDWEHSLVRFRDGKPEHVFLSEHSFGEAYSYQALERIGKRPVIYSATGSHAMYATPGLHPYVLPLGLLHDQTDKGPLWDPALNVHAFTYNVSTDTLLASNHTPHAPTNWFYYRGHWGDKAYPMTDKRQYRFAGQNHYVSGPIGARFKRLGREKICQGPTRAPCHIRNWLPPANEIKEWPGGDTQENDEGEGVSQL